MISLILGMPGSGKTYYTVHLIRKKYLAESDIFFRVREGIVLITNIRLNLDNSDRYIYVENFEDFANLMSVDTAKKLIDRTSSKLVYVVDECQVLFANEKRNTDLFYFLQYHRHLGVDIILITQTASSIPKKVYELAEFVVEAVPKSINPFGSRAFRYRVLHPFDHSLVLRRFHLAFDPAIFYLYSDMLVEGEAFGTEKVESAFRKPVALFVVLLFAFVFFFHLFVSSVVSKPKTGGPSQAEQTKVEKVHYETYEDLISYR